MINNQIGLRRKKSGHSPMLLTLFGEQQVAQKIKLRMEENQLALLGDYYSRKHEIIQKNGKINLGNILASISDTSVPVGMEFFLPKCTQLMTAMESEGRWPTDNAIEWIARFVQKKEQEIPNGDGYWARWSRKENLEMIAEIKYYLGVFKRLRELDLHLISGDLKGFERAIETMRGMPGDSFESIAALLADGHRIQ